MRILNGFTFETPPGERTVKEITDKFEGHAIGKVNETMERYMFYKRSQQEGEDFENFLTDIRTLSQTCQFCEGCKNSMIRDRIVLGLYDNDTRAELLKIRQLTLDRSIDICRAAQSASSNNKMLRPDAVHIVKERRSKMRGKEKKQECRFCGYTHVMRKEKCPAYGKKCGRCGELNHFASKCPEKERSHFEKRGREEERSHFERKSHRTRRDREVNQVEDQSLSTESSYSETDDLEWLNAVSANSKKMVKCKMIVEDQEVTFQIDTGASVNMIPARYAINVQPYSGTLRMWNNSTHKPMGACRLTVINPKSGKKYSVPFIVSDDINMPLLGLRTCIEMKLVTVEEENFEVVARVEDEVFNGHLGTLPGIQHLQTRADALPVVMVNHRIPIAVCGKLKAELDRLVKLGVITPVEQPTPWLSQIVVALKKNGKMRICLDPHELNKVLLREHYTLPILDDVLHEMRQSRVFSKADLSSGFWHVQLDTESSYMTTFQTCFGRYRWLRLPFGLNVSSEIFQKKILDAFDDLAGVVCIADDVLIHGRDKEEHDKHLDGFLRRCKKLGVKLNAEKMETAVDAVTFMGHRISASGLGIDPEKVTAITGIAKPTNVEELRRFIGMINYIAKFVPNLATVMQPLHNLLKKDTEFMWSDTQDKAFNKIKDLVTSATVLNLYDPDKELVIENDASEYGLGSVMLQDAKPIAYSSRALSETEQRYAQIEKEMLAAVYGLEKFHHFTFGREVTVVTDHKPLVAIDAKPLSKAPRRLQNLLMRAKNYNYKLIYKTGKEIPVADALSRAPAADASSHKIEAVNNVTLHPMKENRLDEVRGATAKDEIMVKLGIMIMKGWPDERSKVKYFLSFRIAMS